ncbi:GspH/FimT family pseudopilin [Halomonas maura]|uniref:GspH/FimT family pseudopilin n=1 Tax=Halomonas maura TaxID=117606 RepID=UPI0025B44E32|nr:GspH/FimT family pseudopilin [Halomonas maura]MDN3557128.1 GspH/FimT family pseudopilin [Halomonas maura]
MGQDTAEGHQLTGRPPGLAKPAQRGLTLIELLVALAVMILMATWGVPSFQQFAARNEVTTDVQRVVRALSLARNTAIMTRNTISVCSSQGPIYTNCNFNDWSLDWVIIEGEAAGGSLTGHPILKVLEPLNGVSVTFNRDDRPIRFSAIGWSQGYNGTFVLCGRNGESATAILGNNGRVRTESSSNDDC